MVERAPPGTMVTISLPIADRADAPPGKRMSSS